MTVGWTVPIGLGNGMDAGRGRKISPARIVAPNATGAPTTVTVARSTEPKIRFRIRTTKFTAAPSLAEARREEGARKRRGPLSELDVHQYLVTLDTDGEGTQPLLAPENRQVLARAQVVLPTVPRAGQHLAVDGTVVHRVADVQAGVLHYPQAPGRLEHGQPQVADLDRPAPAGRDVLAPAGHAPHRGQPLAARVRSGNSDTTRRSRPVRAVRAAAAALTACTITPANSSGAASSHEGRPGTSRPCTPRERHRSWKLDRGTTRSPSLEMTVTGTPHSRTASSSAVRSTRRAIWAARTSPTGLWTRLGTQSSAMALTVGQAWSDTAMSWEKETTQSHQRLSGR